MDYQEIYPQKIDAIAAMEHALHGLNARTKAISNNIANVNTPGYKKQTVEFETELKKALEGTTDQNNRKFNDIPLDRTHEKHIGNRIRELQELIDGTGVKQEDYFLNGNNINIDQEMTELTKTGLKYKGVANMTKRHFENMRSIIRGG